ncbi:MAG: hypothetical protein ABI743_13845, partial [bacterium]
RFPFEPVDVSKFAYRLPYAALDVSDCQWCSVIDVMGAPTPNTVSIKLRDWDVNAVEAAGSKLGGEADVTKVQKDASGAPVVEMVQPDLFPTPVTLDLDGGTGAPGDELRYHATFTNDAAWNGEGWMFLRATDPETTDAAFSTYHFGVDPNTLAGDPARALKPRTFMPVRVRAWNSTNWYRHFGGSYHQRARDLSTTPDGHTLLMLGYFSGSNDASPAACEQPVSWGGAENLALVDLDANGDLVANLRWATTALVSDGVAVRGGAGNTYVSFTFSKADNSDGMVSMDIDPTSGTDIRSNTGTTAVLVKIDPTGHYLWGRTWGPSPKLGPPEDWYPAASTYSLTIGPTGNVAVTGDFHNTIDLDPGPGAFTLTGDPISPASYISVFDSSGNWIWGWGGNAGDTTLMAPAEFRSDGTMILLGTVYEPFDVDPGPGQTLIDNGDENAAYRALYSPTGSFISATTWGHRDLEYGDTWTTLDLPRSDGGDWVLGHFRGEVDLDPGPGFAYVSCSPGILWATVQHFTIDNTLAWSGVIKMSSDSFISSPVSLAEVDSNDGLVMMTFVYPGNEMDVDPGLGETWIDGFGGFDGTLFWTRWAADGSFSWEHHTPSAGFNFDLTMLPDDSLIVALHYQDYPIAFDPAHPFADLDSSPALVKLHPDG